MSAYVFGALCAIALLLGLIWAELRWGEDPVVVPAPTVTIVCDPEPPGQCEIVSEP